MTIQPWDSLCLAMGAFQSTSGAATGFGEGFKSVGHVAEGEMILTLIDDIAVDITPPDLSSLFFTSPSSPNNTVEVSVLDATHIRVRLRNPATGLLRAGGFSIMLLSRALGAVPPES